MFLKRIEMQGFKSFADRTVIPFEDDITGIVGPNGCGKSNISDAVRWVLGEQSAKSLRGKNMTDVIFNGSEKRRPVNVAEVVLVFDNSNHFLQSEYQEIEVTRRLHRTTGESEYLINRQPCRLKDIVDLVLDSGLSKDSLSIISQGTIVNFADARAEDRRGLFEEAAGVAKYKKRKTESLSKLARTQDNLDRLQDIIDELEKQVDPLKKQADKAIVYKNTKQELEKIEIAVLVSEIQKCQDELEETKTELLNVEANAITHNIQIEQLEDTVSRLKDEGRRLDRDILNDQDNHLRISNEIVQLEARKTEIDEKRKYLIEHGQDEAKIEQLKVSLEEAKFEYEDRKNRYDALQAQISLLSQTYSGMMYDLSSLRNKSEEAARTVRYYENRRDVLKAQMEAPFTHQSGVQAIMEARDSLPGIYEPVAKAFHPEEGYEEAISTALGGSLYHIITEDEQSARIAIRYLKKNQVGRATFLPLTVCKPRVPAQDATIICQHFDGYLGTAQQFVSNDEIYDNVVGSLLGNVLVCDNLEHANELARLLKFNYKIVTLDGDVCHRGGSMTGGKQKDNYSPMTLQREYERMVRMTSDASAIYENYIQQVNSLQRSSDDTNDRIMQNKILFAQIEPVLQSKRAKYERLTVELENLDPGHIAGETGFEDELLEALNNAYSKRDELVTSIRLKRDKKLQINADSERKEHQIQQTRRALSQIQADQNNLEKECIRIQARMENHLSRLTSEYEMTVDFAKRQEITIDVEEAKQKVLKLRNKIQSLGNINMEAPEQYNEVNERYEFLSNQKNQLLDSKAKIENAIAEMDEVMKTQFMDSFNNINKELQGVFAVLFGGGRARLLLENPDDILESGIEIDVQPPGKNVQNIRLFSGGEKSLIAICVLFAILKARPLPLCIFDEVEAALDPGNVERFAGFIRQFTDTTQFIVVTHRQGTMEHCNVLYGITMPSQGVSQVLKVRLADAMKYIEEKEED
ncbi:MAG: AAA family ATPase [Erysipelotrichaceae bacterium]|nr:AAA family ATPase [Erysipelotrichaceae bacterium]